jgi:hypothetical protein
MQKLTNSIKWQNVRFMSIEEGEEVQAQRIKKEYSRL